MIPIGGERFGGQVPQIVGLRRGPQRAHSSMGERGPEEQGREMECMGVEDPTDRRLRPLVLAIASAGLFLAALDAYAVVTLLPQMLQAVDLPIDHLEAAAPIVTGFLGGYVVAMPLLGAFSDARGRLPAFAVGLGAFAAGSVVTATAPGLGWLVAGRVLQGLGGGALVPLSLALAADLYPSGQRGLAIGAVAAIQEAGSVLGPVYGASLAAGLGGWRSVFWL